MFGILDNKSCVAEWCPRMAIDLGSKFKSSWVRLVFFFFSLIKLVSNPTSDSKRNENAKDAYKSYPHRGSMHYIIWWAQDLAHNMVELGVGFVIMRQGPTWAFAKAFYTMEPLRWWFD